jgi:hypothetical protein
MFKKLALVGLLALIPVAAHAQTPLVTGGGPRLGFSSDPDQLVLGGQLSIGGFAPDWTFDPSLEFGIGSDVTVISFNADANYHFRINDTDWRPYLGGGLGINSVSVDLPTPLRDVTRTEVALNLIVGVGVPTETNYNWFGEIRFGLGNDDAPAIKLVGGLNFKL